MILNNKDPLRTSGENYLEIPFLLLLSLGWERYGPELNLDIRWSRARQQRRRQLVVPGSNQNIQMDTGSLSHARKWGEEREAFHLRDSKKRFLVLQQPPRSLSQARAKCFMLIAQKFSNY